MTQKHVDLLKKAMAVPTSYSEFLCDRIGYVTGYYDDYTELYAEEFDVVAFPYGDDLKNLIKEDLGCSAFGFENSTYYEEGMTREEWVETILIPLAINLP